MFSKETKTFQTQYKEGKIPQEWLDECCGETIALLDGSAERIGKQVGGFFLALLLFVFIFIGLSILKGL